MDDAIDPPPDPLALAQSALGEPEAVFRVSAKRFWTKAGLGLLLMAYSLVGNAVLVHLGKWEFGHVTFLLLVVPFFTGLSLLRHALRSRGLQVLIYETGLLRVQGQQLDSQPWDELAVLVVATEKGEAHVRFAGNEVAEAWVGVATPTFKLGNAGVTLTRVDGHEVQLTPLVEDYAELAAEVQKRAFRAMWPTLWAAVLAGEELPFGRLAVSRAGLRSGIKKAIAWADVTEVVVAGKSVVVRSRAGRLGDDLDNLPNPHLFLGLVEGLRRLEEGRGAREEG